jgi:hypothetical protein
LNKNEREKIRSIFLNNLNDSIFIVSVSEEHNCSKMKCRSLSLDFLSSPLFAQGNYEKYNKNLFRNFVLKWPDFIEFDELNGKIVTKHTDEHAFRVWSLQTYNLLYVLQNESLTEFKIW